MIENLPKRIIWVFIVAVIFVFFWLFMVIKKSNRLVVYIKSAQVISFVAFWLTIQALLSLNVVYNDDVNFFPPKIMLFGIVPAIAAVLIVFLTTKGRLFIDSISLKQLIALHLVRIPVEIVLYQLYLNKAVPKINDI
jgi:fatty acid desaturase